jgi:hypothetical protein
MYLQTSRRICVWSSLFCPRGGGRLREQPDLAGKCCESDKNEILGLF